MNALEITEWLLRQPIPFSKGLIVNRPAKGMSYRARLFQAAMWRRHAYEWNLSPYDMRRQWVESVLRVSKSKCIRIARINLYLAWRIRRTMS